MGDEPPLTVTDLSHAFGPVTVLDGIAFSCPSGTVTAVVGPNGSGKTTLLRIVAGVLRPSAGRVDRPSGTRPVGYLTQAPTFRPTFTVAETLGFYGDLVGSDVDVAATMDRVGLAGVSDRRVDALSGGMKRLLGVALALLGDPPVVLLDEPTGDLDPRMTGHIFRVIETVAGTGTTVLLATHDLAGAAIADEIMVLDRGEIALQGSPTAVMTETDADTLMAAFLSVVGDELTVRAGGQEVES